MKERMQLEQEAMQSKDFLESCGHENSDLRVEEVESAISILSNNSAPSPDEQIFNILLKKRGRSHSQGVALYISKELGYGGYCQRHLNKTQK